MVQYCAHPLRIQMAFIERNPDNPRLATHSDTVESFRERIRDGGGVYPVESAVKLRRLRENRYQMLDGHHRLDAAVAEGLDHLVAFVAEMTDEEALVELLFTNVQHGLTPLEVGLHVLKIEPAQGRAGQGLDSLAKTLGVAPSRLRRYRHAARAFEAVRHGLSTDEVVACRKRTEAIAEIAVGAPPDKWSDMVARCVRERWSAARAKQVVAEVTGAPSGTSAAALSNEAKASATTRRKRSGATTAKSRLVAVRMPFALLDDLKRRANLNRVPYQALLKLAVVAGLPLVAAGLSHPPDGADGTLR